MKAHILVFNAAQIDRQQLQRAVDTIDSVVNWYAFFDNVMCLASAETAKRLSQRLREKFPDLKFIISTVDPDQKGGLMPKSVWSFLNDPQPADEKAA